MFMQTKRALLVCLCAVSFSITVCVQRLDAQVLYGSLLGTVTDQSGAVVPKADVTMTNTGTSQVRKATTDSAGRYSFPGAVPGDYSVTVTASGFKPSTQTGVHIANNAASEANFRLEVGAVTQQVTVEAQATQLQTTQTDVHGELGSKAINNLPLNQYRNFQTLMLLVPGVTNGAFAQGFQNAIADTPERALSFNINGTNRNNNSTLLDGAANINIWLPHHIQYVPSADTLETVNVSTNSFGAEQGNAGGAAITAVTKSGTNNLHGDIYGFHDDNQLRSRNFFEFPRRAKSIFNTDGGHAGGRIIKDKLFWFGGWEGIFQRDSRTGLFTVPTADLRTGNFSRLLGAPILDQNGKPIMVQTTEGATVQLRKGMIFDPTTGNADGTGRKVFSNNGAVNVIPLGRISPAAQKLLALVPPTNTPGDNFNFFNSATQNLNRNQWDLKIDWNPTQKLHLFGKYSAMKATFVGVPALGAAGGPCLCDGGEGTLSTLVQEAALGGTLTVSPNLVIDSTLGWNRLNQTGTIPGQDVNFGSDVLGIPGANGPDPRSGGQPFFNISGFTELGDPEGWNPLQRNDQSYANRTNVHYIKGAHQIVFGVDFNHFHLNHFQPELGSGPRGQFNFGGGVTALNGGASPSQFNSLAAFMLGQFASTGKSIQFQKMNVFENQWGLFVGDTWKYSPKLTVNMGLRWELYPLPLRDARRGLEVFDPNTNIITLTGVNGIPTNQFLRTGKALFAPRFGIAYRLRENIVIRTGYGITYDPIPLSRPFRGFFPLTIGSEFTPANSFAPFGTLDPNNLGLPQGIPDLITPELLAGIQSGQLQLPLTALQRTAPKNDKFKRGYIQSWNFVVEGKLPAGFVGSVGYVGTQTVRQIADTELNAGSVGGGRASEPLFRRFGRSASTLLTQGFLSANYHSLQATIKRNFSNGFFVQGAYTYSKTIDFTDDDGWAGLSFNAPGTFERNRARAGFDVPHNFQLATIYELPFGPGRKFASSGSLVSKIVGGWQVTSMWSIFSGLPFTVTSSGASLNAPRSTQTADQVKPEVQRLGGEGAGQPFFDTTAFAPVTAVRFGNTGRNSQRGPRTFNVDVGAERTVQFTERFRVKIGAEAFNVSNTPHFLNPSANVSDPTSFGIISRAKNDERQFRFHARFEF